MAEQVFPVYRLEQMKPTEHMRIDSRALVGLNLLEDPSQPGHSVFDILNRTRTAGGCRLLKSWLKQPLIQVSAFFSSVMSPYRIAVFMYMYLNMTLLTKIGDA
jgi:DNA mismatch repair ATPase MutS